MIDVSTDKQSICGVRYAILTTYDGSAFSGWQRQKNAISVQQTLEDCWQKQTGETIRLTGGSRTDAGVSARGHVSSFRSKTPIPLNNIPLFWNAKLPDSIAVRKVIRVEDDFNPRYDALGKEYRYRILNRRVRPVLYRHLVAHVPGVLDLSAMRQALPYFAGTHSFLSLMDQGSPTKRPVRTIQHLELAEEDRVITLIVRGDGFLYHMVRILAGTLVLIGQGKMSPEQVPALLETKDRTLAGPTMPPQGLTLERIYFAKMLFGGDCWPYEDERREDMLSDKSDFCT